MAVVKRLIRTDAAGYYVEYTHDDGHIETAPAGRPLTKEDIQRSERQKLTLTNATKTMQAEKTRASFIANDPSASNSRGRDVFNQLVSADATAEFSRAVDAASVIAKTASVRPAQASSLIEDVTLGGPAGNERSEYSAIDHQFDEERVMAFASVEHTEMSATREISNA